MRKGGSEGVGKKGTRVKRGRKLLLRRASLLINLYKCLSGFRLADHVPIAAGDFGVSEAGWVIMLPTDAAS